MALSPEAKGVLLSDPALFVGHYFSHRIERLEDFHLRLLHNATEEPRGLILYPAQHGKCQSPQTLVLMADGTLKETGSIVPGDTLSTGECVASQSNGVSQTVKVTLRTGHEMVCTPNHPFAVRDQRWPEETHWVEAGELVEGDEITLLDDFEASGSSMSLEEFRLLGYMIGDSSTSGGNCQFTTGDDELRDDLLACAKSLGFGVRPYDHPANAGCSDYHLKGGARAWLRQHDLYGKGSYQKRVPAEVFRGTNEQISHFLAAYHACDGSFSRKTSGFEYYSVCLDLLRDVQHLLLRLGIISSITPKNGRYLEQHHQSWRLRISSSCYDKVRRWPILLDRKIPPRGESMERYLAKVVSVEDAGEQETWALQIDSGVHYTADMLTHNTTLVSTLLPIYEICRDPNVQVGLIAKNQAEASSIMLSIQAELVTNHDLIEDFGVFKPDSDESKPWALEKMSVAQRQSNAKEPTIAAFGSGSRGVLGHRTHWTICDDVITEKNSATPEQRATIKQWFMQSVRTMNLPGCRTTVVGTLFDPADLYNDLADLVQPETGESIWSVQREDAIVEVCGCGHAKAAHHHLHGECLSCQCPIFSLDDSVRQTLWPSRWPWKALMELKAEMGTIDFNKRLRNIAVDKSRMVFKEEYVKGGYYQKTEYPGCLDKNHVVGHWDMSWRRVSGFDPAVGTGKSAKFCAHMTLGMGSCAKHERCLWVIDLVRDQMTLPQQCDLILEKHQEYELSKSIVEANSYQVGLYQELQRRMSEHGTLFVIEPHYTTRTNKPDPELGVQAMSPWFENGWVHIPWGNPESQRKMAQFVDELIQYPGRTTDTVMATWFGWKSIQETAPRYKSSNYLRKPGSAWTTLGARKRTIKNPWYLDRSKQEA